MYKFGIILMVLVQLCAGLVHYQPEQIHIAMGDNSHEMTVTWSTVENTTQPQVEYGVGVMNMIANGTNVKFVDGGSKKNTQFIHHVKLTGLEPNTTYVYHCGSSLGWSSKFSFKTFPDGDNWSPHLAIYGDLGNVDGKSFPTLQREAQNGVYDAILHVGDFAYDFDSNEGVTGDEFMRQVQPVGAYVPYMVSPGNHENSYNFSHYRTRFHMPSDNENLYYSFNIGPVHFISFSTEMYYYDHLLDPERQYAWLERDLAEAAKAENRAARPWIITLGHRPMYCTSLNDDDCTMYESRVRVGMPDTKKYGLEPLFYQYGVDMEIWAHEHTYERMWPMYNFNVYNGSVEQPYRNPHAPVHMITGSAGCQEGHDHFEPKPKWSAFRSRDNGFTRMRAYNGSHLHFEQVSIDQGGRVIDEFWVVKDHHEPYNVVDV